MAPNVGPDNFEVNFRNILHKKISIIFIVDFVKKEYILYKVD